MPQNMFCKGQKALTKEGKDNWERIFKEEDEKHCPNDQSADTTTTG